LGEKEGIGMLTIRYRNVGHANCKFKIWGDPNSPPVSFDVPPGGECEIPSGYAGNFMSRRAPSMKKCSECKAEAKPEAKPEAKAKAKPTLFAGAKKTDKKKDK